MKKKKIIVVLSLLAICVGLIFLAGKKSLSLQCEQTTVFKGDFEVKYNTLGYVTSNKHFVSSNSLINTIYVESGDHVVIGDKLFDDKVSSFNGYIESVSEYGISIYDDDFYIEAYLPYEYFNLVNEETKCLFVSNEKAYNIKLKNKYYLGENRNNMVVYRLSFVLEEKEGLLLNQTGNLSLRVDNISECLMVDKKALLSDDDGYFLLDTKFNDNYDIVSNRIDIKVLMMNENYAYISGIGLENRTVCILDETTKEILQ